MLTSIALAPVCGTWPTRTEDARPRRMMSDRKRSEPQSNLEAEALRYAAHTLNETGESWTRDAALLLEQIADEKEGER